MESKLFIFLQPNKAVEVNRSNVEAKENSQKVALCKCAFRSIYFSQSLSERFSPAPCAACHTVWTLPPPSAVAEPSSGRSTAENPCGR